MPRPQSTFKAFLWRLFTYNEEWRNDDAFLAELIRIHFPESLLDKRVGRHRNRLGIWRSEYNRGRLGAPTHKSTPYYNGHSVNAFGKKIESSK